MTFRSNSSGVVRPARTLTVTNLGKVPVLLIDGETFEGGMQNRMLNMSAVIGPGVTDVPVSCVEAGRWGGRRTMTSSRIAPSSVRRVKTAAQSANVYAGRGKVGDQGAVWNEVDATLLRFDVGSDSKALHDMFDEARFQRGP